MYGQMCFFLAVAVCLFISQQPLAANYGISYYGVTPATAIWYGLGLLGTAWFTYRAVRVMDVTVRTMSLLALGLNIMIILVLGVLLSPHTLAPWMFAVHTLASASLFVVQLMLTLWLAYRVEADRLNQALAMGQTLFGIVTLLSLMDFVALMLPGQLAFEACFAAILLRTAKRLGSRR